MVHRRRAAEIFTEFKASMPPEELTEAKILSHGPLVAVIRDIEKVLKGTRREVVVYGSRCRVNGGDSLRFESLTVTLLCWLACPRNPALVLPKLGGAKVGCSGDD